MTKDVPEGALIVEKFNPVRHYATHVQDADRILGVFIDCETTGLDPEVDEIIQLAIVPFTFSNDGIICTTGEPYIAMQEPTHPLTEEITRITGLTDEMLKGQRIDPLAVYESLRGAKFVVTHNADFDRKFLEKAMPVFEAMHFGCSMSDVPWKEYGYGGVKLEWLMFRHLALWYESHRADIDSYVGIHLLASQMPDGRTGMAHVLEAARKKYVRISARNSPYEKRHVLKRRKYKWNPDEKVWWKDVAKDAVDDERRWLAMEAGCTSPTLHGFGAQTRFSNRIGRKQ